MKLLLALALLAAPAGAAEAPFIDWENLENPVLEYPDWSIKDFAAAHKDGVFHVFFSAFQEDRGEIRSHVAQVTTRDWRTFSGPLMDIDGEEEGWTGYCSPNIIEHEGTWYLTFNSWGKVHPNGGTNDLFYRESTDLVNWSEVKPVAPGLTAGKTCIDIALLPANGRFFLFLKDDYLDHDRVRVKQVRLAVADSMDGPWRFVGNGQVSLLETADHENGQHHENYCFVEHEGRLVMLTSDYGGGQARRAALYRLLGDGDRATDFLLWGEASYIPVPEAEWATRDTCNAAFLADWREQDGHYYLLYAGSHRTDAEGRSYAGRGWNRLGLLRSRDLETWELPGVTQ